MRIWVYENTDAGWFNLQSEGVELARVFVSDKLSKAEAESWANALAGAMAGDADERQARIRSGK